MNKIFAPFDEQQIASIDGFQACPEFHPYTCCNHQSMRSRTNMLAYRAGLVCPNCGRLQKWAWDFSADGSWKETAEKVSRYRRAVMTRQAR